MSRSPAGKAETGLQAEQGHEAKASKAAGAGGASWPPVRETEAEGISEDGSPGEIYSQVRAVEQQSPWRAAVSATQLELIQSTIAQPRVA